MFMRKLILFLLLITPIFAFAADVLTPYQYLKTSGARTITPFTLDGNNYIAVPQLSEDVKATPNEMNIGNADVDVIIFKWQHKKFVEYQRIPSHGNEDAQFFTIGDRAFLAIASIKSGPGPLPPYNLNTYSKLYEWDGK